MRQPLVWCAVLLVCSVMPAPAAEPVKVGVVFARTGPAAASNVHYLRTVEFAAAEINAAGGGKHPPLDLIVYDNLSSAIGSRQAARRAVSDGVAAVVGASWSAHSLAMAPVLQAAAIPMITPSSTNPKVTLTGDFIFRTCFIDTRQGQAMAQFARLHLDAERAIVLTDTGSRYSLGLSRAFKRGFTEMDGQLVWEGEYLEGVTAYDRLLAEAGTVSADVVFVPGRWKDSADVIAKARALNVRGTFLGGDGWGDLMYQTAGGAIQGAYYSEHWHPDSDSPLSKGFVERYTAMVGEIKTFGVALAYDAVHLLSDAIRRAESAEPVRIRDALAATMKFEGVTGTITFDDNGDPVKPVVIVQFHDGGTRFVKRLELK